MKIFIFCLLIGVSWVPRSNIIQMVDALKPKPKIFGVYWIAKQIVNKQKDIALCYYWNSLPHCVKDDVMTFNEEGTMCFFRNEKCTPEEGAKECYAYTLFDRNKINITSEEESLSFEVMHADDMHLVLRQLWSDGEEFKYIDIEFERFGMDLVCK